MNWRFWRTTPKSKNPVDPQAVGSKLRTQTALPPPKERRETPNNGWFSFGNLGNLINTAATYAGLKKQPSHQEKIDESGEDKAIASLEKKPSGLPNTENMSLSELYAVLEEKENLHKLCESYFERYPHHKLNVTIADNCRIIASQYYGLKRLTENRKDIEAQLSNHKLSEAHRKNLNDKLSYEYQLINSS